MQSESEHVEDLQAVINGQRGGRLRMAQLGTRERSELGRSAAFANHHAYQFKLQQEREKELVRVVKQALDDYLPRDKRLTMEP